jgi:hypothetical protein
VRYLNIVALNIIVLIAILQLAFEAQKKRFISFEVRNKRTNLTNLNYTILN